MLHVRKPTIFRSDTRILLQVDMIDARLCVHPTACSTWYKFKISREESRYVESIGQVTNGLEMLALLHVMSNSLECWPQLLLAVVTLLQLEGDHKSCHLQNRHYLHFVKSAKQLRLRLSLELPELSLTAAKKVFITPFCRKKSLAAPKLLQEQDIWVCGRCRGLETHQTDSSI